MAIHEGERYWSYVLPMSIVFALSLILLCPMHAGAAVALMPVSWRWTVMLGVVLVLSSR